MYSVHTMKVYWFALCIALASSEIYLDSSTKWVCPGEPVMLHCVATSLMPTSLYWSSGCYIGVGGIIIEYPPNTYPNTTTPSTLNGSGTVAVYHGYRIVSGSYVYYSTLLIDCPKDGPCEVICATLDGQQNETIIQVSGPPSESGRNFEVVNVTDKQDYFLNMTWESSPDPVKHYAVEYNGFNLTTSSTAISIPVNCSSAVNIYITAIGPCGKPSPRVQVISVNTSICESSSAMVTRANGMVVMAISVLAAVLLGNMEEFRRMLALCVKGEFIKFNGE